MPVLRFFGKVYPAAVKVNFHREISIRWAANDLGFPIEVSATCCDSVVEATCTVPRYEEKYLSTLLARTYNLIETVTDLSTFGMGLALWVELDTVVKPNGTRETLLKCDPSLERICTAFKMPPGNPVEQREFDRLIKIVLGEPALMGSLRDLAEVVLHYNVTPTNCGRVLDTLRKAIAPNEKKERGWELLRETVNADENYMDWVSRYSTGTRHGDRATPISGNIVMEIRDRTWNVMNRILEYRKGGNAALGRTKFPLLVHDPVFAFPPKP
jgi:hypothetical protein